MGHASNMAVDYHVTDITSRRRQRHDENKFNYITVYIAMLKIRFIISNIGNKFQP